MKLSQIWTAAATAVKDFFKAPEGFSEFLARNEPVQPLPVYLTLRHLEKNHG